MRIAINATYRLHGGGLTHLQHLLSAWSRTGVDREHSITLFTRSENIALLQTVLNERITLCAMGKQPANLVAKLAWEQWTLPRILAERHIDVLFCPGNVVPLRSPVPTVVAFRNAGPFCTSMTLKAIGGYDWLWFKVLAVLMRLSAHAATRVIFVSHYFKNLFVQRFGFPPERADVIYHGRDALSAARVQPDMLRRLGVSPPYLLSTSHLYPYKNIPALIDGYALARQPLQEKGLRLILAGKPSSDTYAQQLRERIRRHGLAEWVQLVGSVPHPVVGSLLAGCEFLVFQSTCESISISLVEGLTAEAPIACANVGVMPEIAGDAALYFNPFDASDIARALICLAEDATMRLTLRQKALHQAKKFPTWDEVGQLTLRSLERAMSGY